MGHLHHATKSRFDRTPRKWLAVGSQINELVNKWADRSDIVTFVGEGAGMGHAACFVPAIAEMEVSVDQAFDGSEPEVIPDLTVRKNQFDYPVAMGAILHEAMHAKHSELSLLVDINDEKDALLRTIATAFEETRIESRGVKAFPKNRAFLRACALKLVIGDIAEDEDFAARGLQSFSHLILLTLARVDAGVLEASDVEYIHDAAVKLFGADLLAALRGIWVRAQAHDVDSDGKALIALAREWVKALEDAGHDPKAGSEEMPDWLKELLKEMAGSGAGGESGEGADGEPTDGEGSGGSILEKMAEAAAEGAQGEANDQAVQEVRDEIAEARAQAGAESKEHKDMASKVFSRGTGPGGGSSYSSLIKKRAPQPDERAAAVALGKALEKARYRDRVQIKSTSITPPGRLSARRAIAAAEQKSRGADVTAEAWARKIRKHTEDPTLTVGVMVDISGSMSSAMEPMASAAWVLSEATRRVQGRCAMVYYGNDVFPVLKPGQHLTEVNVYDAPDGTEKFDRAFKALDGSLNLLNGTGARLLVIVSDLHYTGIEREAMQKWMKRCSKSGVAVIVAPFDYDATAREVVKKIKGIELLGTDKTRGGVVNAAKAIGQAAIRQLENASS